MADHLKIESLLSEAEERILEAAAIVDENFDYKRLQKEFGRAAKGVNLARCEMNRLIGGHKFRVAYLKQGTQEFI